MPKSEILLLRRWPCWPGPYSRRLTGLLGRPKTFSPMRRSSLYLALVRFVTGRSPIRVLSRPEPHRQTLSLTRSPLHRTCGINCEAGRLPAPAFTVNLKRAAGRPESPLERRVLFVPLLPLLLGQADLLRAEPAL